MIPKVGPVRYRVTSVDAEIAAGATLGPVEFRFPRPVFVTSILLTPKSGLRADMAKLRLRIQDETSQDMIADGIGAHEASALALMGLTPLTGPLFGSLVLARPFVLQRPVNAGDKWYFTLENVGADPIIPELSIGFSEGRI